MNENEKSPDVLSRFSQAGSLVGIALAVIIACGGFAMGMGANNNRVAALEAKAQIMEGTIPSIDRRLARIEGKLGVGQ